jgi:hypothetical protein
MSSLLERLEERAAAARSRVERLHAQIASLSAELAAEEQTLSRLTITRETVLTMLAGDDEPGTGVDRDAGVAASPVVSAAPAVPMPAAYQQLLDVFTAAGQPLRAKQVCQALGTGTEARQVEKTRVRLKRLVDRGVLSEPEPGMFVMADAADTAGTAGPATMALERKEDQ